MRAARMAALLVALSVPVAARAHHSITAVYDSARQVTVTGTVRAFHFVNPHPWVGIEVTDEPGRSQTWRLDLDNRFELVDIGMKADTFKPGDRVIARGSAARDGSNNLYALQLDREADGLHYEQVGPTPHLRLPAR